ncbi:MAG: carbohydrate-binding domain-containing protein [Planctomycetota bacterium]
MRPRAMTLEPRLMLAAEVGAVVALDAASDGLTTTSEHHFCSQTSEAAIVFVDPGVPDLEVLLKGIPESAEIVLLDSASHPLRAISRVLQNRSDLRSVHVVSHASAGRLMLSGHEVNCDSLANHQDLLATWQQAFVPGGDLLLYGCELAGESHGANLLQKFSSFTGLDIAASSDKTGNACSGGDWVLERSIGSIETSVIISRSIQQRYRGVLDITIYAAGLTGSEQMELQIDGEAVQSWSNVGGDFSLREFESFTYETAATVAASQVRVGFVNDGTDVNGADRNLVVDRIEIDGRAFEAEDDSTFATGTWNPDNNATVPGFREDEWLHANGFLQFADQNATTIEVKASGTTGEELIRVTSRGGEIASWQLSTETETYTVSVDRLLNTSSDEIRIEFLNDLYLPELSVDRNVLVDQIQLNGIVFETNSEDTYSTGTWTEADGLTSGYLRGSILHANGYLQLDAAPSDVIVRASGDVGTEQFSIEIDREIQSSFEVSSTFEEFSYTHDGPLTANDLRVVFLEDGSSPGLDQNLNVDWIEVDGVRVQTDSPFVFADGVFDAESQSITSGYGLGEKLNAEGYFQFATGSVIEIVVRGDTGKEDFELVLGTTRQRRFDVSNTNEIYQFVADGQVSPSGIRIEYQSDGFDPELGDRNLFIDSIKLDGKTFETEAASTYSSGTGFVDGAVQHGFGHGEGLYVNGFFRYLGYEIVADEFSIPEDSIDVPLAVFANDTKSEFNVAELILQSAPTNGTVELRDNAFYYTPNEEFEGSDTFEYLIASNNGSRVPESASISVIVNASHQQPQSLINPAVAPELTPSGEFLEVRRYAKLPTDENGRQPRMNSFATTGDRSFVIADGSADGEGEIYELVSDGSGGATAERFFDVASAIFANTGLIVDNSSTLFGVRSAAFHPEFESNGKFYTAYTGERPADPAGFNYLSDPANPVPVDNVLAEWTVDLQTGEVIEDSYRELFRVDMVAADHPIQNMIFNPFASQGDDDYGLLYIGHGDGSIQSAIAGDGQNADGLGKILRIDPLAANGNPYSIPAENPFADGAEFPPEVYAYGFRNPHNLSFAIDSQGIEHLIVADVGRDNVEEINVVVAGGNYGWADREGVFVHLREELFVNGNIAPLPANDAVNEFIYPVAILGHDGQPGDSFVGQAIIGGHVIQNGSADLDGQYILGEFATDGRAYHIDFAEMLSQITSLVPGVAGRDSPEDLTWLTPQELTILFDHDNDSSTQPLVRNSLKDVLDDEPDFARIVSAGKLRADLRFGQGPVGELLILNKRNGWVYVASNTEPA